MTERTAADIESGIRETRDRMSENIDAIGEKLSPARITERTKEAIRHKAKETGAGLMRAARENPVPAAMVLVGLTWLLRARPKDEQRSSDATHGLKAKAHELADAGKEKVGQVSHRVADTAKRTGSTVQRFFEDNALIGSAAAVVLGAALGAMLPHTRKEDQLMGPARDQLMDEAGGAVRHAREAFEEKLSERAV